MSRQTTIRVCHLSSFPRYVQALQFHWYTLYMYKVQIHRRKNSSMVNSLCIYHFQLCMIMTINAENLNSRITCGKLETRISLFTRRSAVVSKFPRSDVTNFPRALKVFLFFLSSVNNSAMLLFDNIVNRNTIGKTLKYLSLGTFGL